MLYELNMTQPEFVSTLLKGLTLFPKLNQRVDPSTAEQHEAPSPLNALNMWVHRPIPRVIVSPERGRLARRSQWNWFWFVSSHLGLALLGS